MFKVNPNHKNTLTSTCTVARQAADKAGLPTKQSGQLPQILKRAQMLQVHKVVFVVIWLFANVFGNTEWSTISTMWTENTDLI